MIGRLSGRLLEMQAPHLLVDVQGVGYELEAPMSTVYVLPPTGGDVVLHTHFVVREDAQLLYGFATTQERQFFRELLRISGVGGKMALAVLSSLSASDLLAAIEQGDVDQLVRVPGIGKKTAERMLLELRGRVSRFDSLRTGTQAPASGSQASVEAEDALLALGYSAADVRRMLKKVDPALDSPQEIIRAALQRAGR